MKRILWVAVVIILALAAGCLIYVPSDEYGRQTPPEGATYEGGDQDISYFYDYLAPHGNWVDLPRYGACWFPRHMRFGWRPYTDGRWVWTDYGWTWVSDFEWGWVPFHYGRWGFDRDLGWFWVPDTVWGPAWVAWRTGDLHIGWAPLPPEAEFVSGVGLRSSGFDIPLNYWVFIDGGNFWNDRLYRYVLPYERNLTIINFTVINIDIRSRGDRVYNEGFDPDYARRLTGRPITKYRLRDPNRAGSARLEGDELLLHKPVLSRSQLARPKKVLRRDEVADTLAAEDIVSPSEVDAEQIREKKLLEKSQETEIGEIRRKVGEDRKLARTTEEKARIENEVETKVSELRKKHSTEKADLEKRQKDEGDKVRKGKLRKKD